MEEIKVVSDMKNEKYDSFSAVNENGGSLVEDVVGDEENANGIKEIRGKETSVNQESIVGDDGNVDEGCKHQFLVGDLVWAKVKNYPWWPGLIYDPSDASDFALKFKNGNKILVACFGDGSASWCSPSQLVPFVEDFEKMSKQSSSKSFVYGVEEALGELGRRIELKMYCCCVPEGSLSDLPRPEAMNAGVRSGVLMPNGASDKLPSPWCEPADLLECARTIAVACPVSKSLEILLLKSWLSSIALVKMGRLPIYHEPQLIEGVEDKSKNVVPDTNDSSSIAVPIEGPSEKELDGSRNALPIIALMATSSQKRKQKSFVELMGESTGVKPKRKKKSEITGEAPTTAENRKAISDDEKIEDPIDDVEEDTEEKTLKRFISSASLTKCKSATSKENVSGNSLKLGTNPRTINEKTENCSMDINTYADQILAKVLCAGVDLMSMDISAIKPLRGFMSAFRSSKFLNASSYELFNDQKSHKKRKLSVLGREYAAVAHNEMINKLRPRVTKLKKDGRDAPANKEEVDETAPNALIITFGSNDLPSMDEIIKTLSQFGSINEEASKLIHDSNCARVVFINTSNAELAFKESIKQALFSGKDVRYNLRYISDASRMFESGETTSKSPRTRSLKHSVCLQPTVEDVSQVDFVRQQTRYLTSLLKQYDGTISLEEKSNLEDELRSMLRMVGELAVKASS